MKERERRGREREKGRKRGRERRESERVLPRESEGALDFPPCDISKSQSSSGVLWGFGKVCGKAKVNSK